MAALAHNSNRSHNHSHTRKLHKGCQNSSSFTADNLLLVLIPGKYYIGSLSGISLDKVDIMVIIIIIILHLSL